MSKDWRSKPRIFWGRELTAKVIAAMGPYWQTHTADDAFAQAQEDVGIEPKQRRPYVQKIGAMAQKRLGKKPLIKVRHKIVKRRPNGEQPHVEAVAGLIEAIDESTAAITGTDAQEAVTATDPAPTIQTPSESGIAASAPIPAAGAVSSPGSLDAAFAVIGKAFGGIIRDALADGIARALTNPAVAASFAEVLRPLVVQSAAIAEPVHDEPSPQQTLPLDVAAQEAKAHKREREDLPRVLVAGMLPTQIHKIEEAFAGRATLRFWKSSDSQALLRKQVPGIDAAVGMVGFMGHSADHILASRAPTYLRASGGVTSVKRQIEQALKMVSLERSGHVAPAS